MNSDFTATADPNSLFSEWLREAEASEPNDPNAMALATVDGDGLPNVRMVLLKGHDPAGFVFYTNFESAKGEELAVNPRAALLFHWKSLKRQVRVRGTVEPVSEAEADAYFASRARTSRLGAWASQQSRPLESRFALEKAVAAYAAKYPVGDGAAAALLVGLPPDAGGVGVLEGHALPPAQPRALPPRRRRLADVAALSVAAAAVPLSRATRPAWRPLPDARPSSPGW